LIWVLWCFEREDTGYLRSVLMEKVFVDDMMGCEDNQLIWIVSQFLLSVYLVLFIRLASPFPSHSNSCQFMGLDLTDWLTGRLCPNHRLSTVDIRAIARITVFLT
jgi:hypothetical protein